MHNLLAGTNILILGGGSGKRLRPAVSDRQKVLAEVSGRPFITYILDQIETAGGEKVILCTGYMGEQFETILGRKYKSLSLHYSREDEPLGTAGAIRNALDLITSDTVILLNGDSYCDIALPSLLAWHFDKNAACTLSLARMPDVSRYGSVNFDANHLVTSFSEKTLSGKRGWINAGIYCLCREIISCLPENKNISLEKDIFPALLPIKKINKFTKLFSNLLIDKGFFAFPQDVEFIDIGIPSSYKEAENFFRLHGKL